MPCICPVNRPRNIGYDANMPGQDTTQTCHTATCCRTVSLDVLSLWLFILGYMLPSCPKHRSRRTQAHLNISAVRSWRYQQGTASIPTASTKRSAADGWPRGVLSYLVYCSDHSSTERACKGEARYIKKKPIGRWKGGRRPIAS